MDASTNDVTAMVWQKALVPETPVSPPPVRTAAAAALGTLVGIGLAFLFEYLDNGAGKGTSWRSHLVSSARVLMDKQEDKE